MLKTLGAALSILIMMTGAASAAARENAVKIEFVFKGVTVVGLLDESAAASAFVAQLPMTVKLEDYGSTEKIAWLPEKLRDVDAGESMTPRRGDMAYYAPWGNLAIFSRRLSPLARSDKARAGGRGTGLARPARRGNGDHQALLSLSSVK
ncbi:Uncharacterized conserved protein [Klebsiella oxytoca]|nr:Uncharacterized conserved protein [Klebsiella oxytoca]